MPAKKFAKPATHHLDRRADHIIGRAPDGDADNLLSTKEVATWLGVSEQWVEIGRHRGYGPKFVKVAARRIRYRRGDVIAFLRERTHASTAEYAHKRKPRGANAREGAPA